MNDPYAPPQALVADLAASSTRRRGVLVWIAIVLCMAHTVVIAFTIAAVIVMAKFPDAPVKLTGVLALFLSLQPICSFAAAYMLFFLRRAALLPLAILIFVVPMSAKYQHAALPLQYITMILVLIAYVIFLAMLKKIR